MKEQFLKVAFVCAFIDETITVSAFVAESSEDSIVYDLNNKVL